MWGKVLGAGGARVFGLAATLLSTAVTARVLGPDGRGVLVAALAWVSLFSTVGHLSLSQVAVHQGAGRDKDEWVGRILGTLLALVCVIAVAGWVLALVAYLATDGAAFRNIGPAVLLVAFLQLPLLLWIEAGLSVFLLLDALPAANRAQVAGGCVSVAATLVLVAGLRAGIPGALASVLLAQLVTVGLGLAAVRRRVRGVRPSWAVARSLVAGGLRLHPSVLGTFMTVQVPVLLLNQFRPAAETGYFQLALQFLSAGQLVATAVSLVAYTLVGDVGPDRAWAQQRRLLGQAVALSAAGAVAGWLLAPLAFRLVGGAEFAPGVPVFRVMLLAVPGMTFAIVMASQWVGRGFFARVAALSVCTGLLSVAGSYYGISRFGVMGAAWALVCTYGMGVVVNGIMAVWVQRVSAPARAGGGPFSDPVEAS